jgi:hypothetical protein
MRVDCETWTYTALKEKASTVSQTESTGESTIQVRNDLVIEQKIQLDQALYSTDSSGDEAVVTKKTKNSLSCCLPMHCSKAKIRTDKRLDINFELINVSFVGIFTGGYQNLNIGTYAV